MTKNENDINSLINKAIDASIEFEGIIDSIDFNSYLPGEQEDEKVKKSSKYKSYYKDKIDNALASLNVEENKQSNPNDEYKFIKKLIDELFNAKKIRLDGRQQVEWKEETKRYDECTCLLHSNLDSIHLQEEKFNDIRKDNETTDRFNIIRVLYYNELAICYSGFKKSSMSLGYAEESIALLEKLYSGLKNFEKPTGDILNKRLADSKKVIENLSHIIGLYTFALLTSALLSQIRPDRS